jgi:transcriptional regulator with XRE-family HTH domain
VIPEAMDKKLTPEAAAGQRVAQLRKHLGWSQDRLAEQMTKRGFPWKQSTVTKTETAGRPIRVNEFVDLAEIFGVETTDLLYGPDPDSQSGRLLRDTLSALRRMNAAKVVKAQADLEYHEASAEYERVERRFNETQRARQENPDHD